jgi:ABC-2 type transport system ATP-binding protein
MTTLDVQGVSKWFGDTIAVNAVSMRFRPGITALLGPNGAGKSTLLSMMAGFMTPGRGSIFLDGRPVGERAARGQIGLVLQAESSYDTLTGNEFITAIAKLHRVADAVAATRAAIEDTGMTEVADRRIGTYSKGMRQRIRVAAALVHDPPVMLLDEPFNGMDPVQRQHLMKLLCAKAERGYTIVISSHILDEVEQFANRIEVVSGGRHAASGDFKAIRRLMSGVPHRYRMRSTDNRRLAGGLIGHAAVRSVSFSDDRQLDLEVIDLVEFSHLLPQLVPDLGVELHSVQKIDDSLESVFGYLMTNGANR